MMSYINETDFVIENKKLVYPEIVTDGLQLYYDAKGKRDTDYHRDTMLDMSGNKNHGKLHNFAYEKHSGYKDGLVFDYIDDKLVRPKLDLKPDDFTFMLNGNIISFSPDGTVKRVQDGEVIESKGFNLVRNGDFVDGTKGWTAFQSKISVANNGNLKVENNGGASYAQVWRYIDLAPKSKYYFRAKFGVGNKNTNAVPIQWFIGGVKSSEGLYEVVKENTSEEINRQQLKFSDTSALGDYYYISDIQLINLTETFGAGNEPTKEQMGEIINRFGFVPNAQDLIDRLEYKGNDLGDMENIIDGLYKTEVLSGEEIYTDKADDDAVVHVEIDGKSVGGGSGKNMFYSIYSHHSNAGYNSSSWTSAIAKIEPNKTYTVSYTVTNSNRFSLWQDTLSNGIKSNRVDTSSISYRNTTIGEKIEESITTDERGGYLVIYLSNNKNNARESIQIEEGSVATAYEPPAPTPDYPIEIHSLNDFDVVSSTGRENILENSSFRDNISGWSAMSGVSKAIKDGYDCYVIEHTEFGATKTLTQGIIADIKVDKRYIVSGWVYTEDMRMGPTNPTKMFYIDGNDIDGKWMGLGSIPFPQNSNKWVHVSYITNIITERHVTGKRLAFFIHTRDIIGKVYVRDVKMEAVNSSSDTYTDWTPSPRDIAEDTNHPLIDKINLLLDEPLRSVGDVKDRLFRDNDGLWKVEHKVGEIVLDGNGTWTQYSSWTAPGTSGFYQRRPIDTSTISNRSHINTRFKSYTEGLYNLGKGISDEGLEMIDYFKLSINTYRLSSDSVTGLKEWLSKNPIKVVYELGKGNNKIIILPQSLQDKLNNLRSFEDSNYVYTVLSDENNNISDNIKPTLHAKFLYNNWYKEDRVINNLMIYNRALTNEEMLQNYKTIKRRWGM